MNRYLIQERHHWVSIIQSSSKEIFLKIVILEGYGEKRKEKYDEIRAKYGLRGDPNNPFEEDEPAEKPAPKKSFFSKLKKK